MTEETEKIITEDINQAPSSGTQNKDIDNSNPPKRPILHTMKSDMQEYIDQQKMSIVDIAGKEARRQGLKISTAYNNWTNKLITIMVIMLVIISVGVFSYTVIKKKNSQKTGEVSEQNLPTPIVLPNKQSVVTITIGKTAENKNIVKDLLQTDTQIGNLTNFIFTDESKVLLTPEKFFKSLEINTPFGFSTFLTDRFMFGVYSLEKNEPFIILKVRSYENVFALMLKWENTIKDDLNIILPNDTSLNESLFQDRIVKNHDTRILYDQNGQIDILYSFLDKDTIIMTSSMETFEEILKRLSSSKL